MPKKNFTTVTPLPPNVSRSILLETLQDHLGMIDLNPSHISRHRIDAPRTATPEEYFCRWYQITDHITVCPGLPQKAITFNACFHNLANGSQIHCYAPMGLDIKQKWTIGGNAPGEPTIPTEIGIGAPVSGLYIREDVELKCNLLALRFVRRTLKDALEILVARLVLKAELQEAAESNQKLDKTHIISHQCSPLPPLPPPPLSPSNFLSNRDSYPASIGYGIEESRASSNDNERKSDPNLKINQCQWPDGIILHNDVIRVELP